MMNRHAIRRGLFALILGMGALSAPAAAETLEADATSYLRGLADETRESLAIEDAAQAQRTARFRRLFKARFDVAAIGRRILGHHWRTASQAERIEFLGLFENLMVVSYVDRFQKYAGQELNITKALAQNGKSVVIYSEIRLPDTDKPVRVNWQVARRAGAQFKIHDVVVEGASLSATFRADFGSIIRQKGGTVAGLLAALREKTASLEKTEPKTKSRM